MCDFFKIIVNGAVFTNGVSVGQKCHFDVLSGLGSSISTQHLFTDLGSC